MNSLIGSFPAKPSIGMTVAGRAKITAAQKQKAVRLRHQLRCPKKPNELRITGFTDRFKIDAGEPCPVLLAEQDQITRTKLEDADIRGDGRGLL